MLEIAFKLESGTVQVAVKKTLLTAFSFSVVGCKLRQAEVKFIGEKDQD